QTRGALCVALHHLKDRGRLADDAAHEEREQELAGCRTVLRIATEAVEGDLKHVYVDLVEERDRLARQLAAIRAIVEPHREPSTTPPIPVSELGEQITQAAVPGLPEAWIASLRPGLGSSRRAKEPQLTPAAVPQHDMMTSGIVDRTASPPP